MPSSSETKAADEFRGQLTVSDDGELDALVELSRSVPVLLYFSATWCGPCKIFGPQLERYVASRASLVAAKIDGDDNPRATDFCDVEAFPHTSVLRHGRVHWTREGTLDESELAATLDAVLTAVDEADVSDVTSSTVGAPTAAPESVLSFPDLSSSSVRLFRSSRDLDRPAQQVGVDGAVELIATAGDEFALSAHADDRRSHPLNLCVLRDLPPVELESVTLEGTRLEAPDLVHLQALARVRTLIVIAAEPLGPSALEALAGARADRLHVLAPGIDAAALAVAMPGSRVNGIMSSPAVEAALKGVSPLARVAAFTTVADLRAAATRGGHTVAMVQAEHEEDLDVAESWHRAHRAGNLPPDVLTVSAFGDGDLIRDLSLERRRPAIVSFAGGRMASRDDLPAGDDALRELLVARTLEPQQSLSAPGSWPLLPARTITPDSDARHTRVFVELVPPGTAATGAAFFLTPGTSEPVPDGWSVRARWQVWNDPAVPWAMFAQARLQDLDLQVVRQHDGVDLDGLQDLPDLVGLVLDAGTLTSTFLDRTAVNLPRLRRLRLVGATDEQLAQARDILPEVTINGSWPALPPSLAVTGSESV